MAIHCDSQRNSTHIDLREQPYNQRESGPIHEVQLPLLNITSLHGIVFDLDLDLYRADAAIMPDLSGPAGFCERTLEPMILRHPALRGAEVRDTGRNVHAIVWFDRAVEFTSDAERTRWSHIVEIVQAALPIDPHMPGITVLTRPIGSVNAKTGRPVSTLRFGTPTPVEVVLELRDQMTRTPFKTVAGILFGSDRITPCPVCRTPGSSLGAFDRHGFCYPTCGKVALERLYDALLSSRAVAGKEAARGDA